MPFAAIKREAGYAVLSEGIFIMAPVLLKRVVLSLGIQVKEVKESSNSLVDILAATGPSEIALPVDEAIMDLVKTLWQISTSNSLCQKGLNKNTLLLPGL